MPYTAQGTYYDEGLSAADKAAVAEYKRQWADAYAKGDTAAMEAAHAGAEAIRAASGYSGGDDGSDYIRVAPAVSAAALAKEYRALYSEPDDSYEKERAARQAAVEKAVNTLEGTREDAQARYSDLFRQLYLDKLRAQKNLDQKLAVRGVTGGAAETTRLGYDTAYEDALRQGEQERIAALGDIDRAIADARLTGDVESANAAAKAARERTDAYADALRYLINRQDTLAEREEKTTREDAAAARRYAEQLAEQRAAAEAAEKKAAEQAEKEAAEQVKPTLTAAQVLAALKAGVRTEAVLRAYEYYYGQPYRQ